MGINIQNGTKPPALLRLAEPAKEDSSQESAVEKPHVKRFVKHHIEVYLDASLWLRGLLHPSKKFWVLDRQASARAEAIRKHLFIYLSPLDRGWAVVHTDITVSDKLRVSIETETEVSDKDLWELIEGAISG